MYPFLSISGKVSPSESFPKMKIFFKFIADTPEIIIKIAWCERIERIYVL